MEKLATHSPITLPETGGAILGCPLHRDDVAPLHLLKAEDLPASAAMIRQLISQETVAALRLVVRVGPHDSDAHALAVVDAALRRLPVPVAPATYTDAERRSVPEDLYEEHDQFFGAVRVIGNPVEVFTRTTLEAVRSQLHDALSAGVGLQTEEWAQLRSSFWTTFHLLWRIGAVDSPWVDLGHEEQPPPELDIRPVSLDPLIRWRLGHQVFFALIQALVVTVGCLDECLGEDRGADGAEEASRLIEDATVLMIGSGAALRYAGDFTRSLYADVVRPAMMPPHINPKFSGLQLRDHRMLLNQLRRVKPRLNAAAPRVHESYGRLVEAMSTAYDAHVAVCARFNGDQESSLRTPGSKVPAVGVLRRFQKQRAGAVSLDPRVEEP